MKDELDIIVDGFNPAEAEEGFKSKFNHRPSLIFEWGFNPAEAEEGFKRQLKQCHRHGQQRCFNPAEAEEGFKRKRFFELQTIKIEVSIQPKPKKGLKDITRKQAKTVVLAVSIQPKPKKGLKVTICFLIELTVSKFQSSRSRRRV